MEHLIFHQLPLSRVLEFLPLRSILACRRSCSVLAEAADGLCPRACAAFLRRRMRKRNAYLVAGSWYEDGVVQDADGLVDALLAPTVPTSTRGEAEEPKEDRKPAAAIGGTSKSSSRITKDEKYDLSPVHSSAFDRMMRCMRAMRFIPDEGVIAFNGKFGRFLLPLALPSSSAESDTIVYPRCTRGKSCPTCKFRIPPAEIAGRHGTSYSKDDNDVYKYLQIQGMGGNIDLTRFYNTCAPNIPADLACPLCLSGTRTLVLGQGSYVSSSFPGREDRHVLTYTPTDKEEASERLCDEEGSDCSAGSRPPSGDIPDQFQYPPLVGDLSMPPWRRDLNREQQIDAKFALSIHCSACRRFGIVVPATRCGCPEENHVRPPNGMSDVVLGAKFVTTRCGGTGCQTGTRCWNCSREKFRDSDVDGCDVYCGGCLSRFCDSCSTDRYEEYERLRGRGQVGNCACAKRKRKTEKHSKKRSKKRRRQEEMVFLAEARKPHELHNDTDDELERTRESRSATAETFDHNSGGDMSDQSFGAEEDNEYGEYYE